MRPEAYRIPGTAYDGGIGVPGTRKSRWSRKDTVVTHMVSFPPRQIVTEYRKEQSRRGAYNIRIPQDVYCGIIARDHMLASRSVNAPHIVKHRGDNIKAEN